MQAITRIVYLTENRRIEPICVVYGSNVPVALFFGDYTPLGSDTVKAYAWSEYSRKTVTVPASHYADSEIGFPGVVVEPATGFFMPGKNKLQFEIGSGDKVITFSVDVLCDEELSNGVPAPKPETIAMAVDDFYNRVADLRESIPEVSKLTTIAAQARTTAAEAKAAADDVKARADAGQFNGHDYVLTAADKVEIAQISTALYAPNLLDNSYMVAPVNQRNRTEYTDGSGYTIDRWVAYDEVSVYVRTGYVSLQASRADATFNQVIDTAIADSLRNKRLTLAVCLNDGSVACGAFTLSSGIDNRIATGAPGWNMGVYFRDNGQLVVRMIHSSQTMSAIQIRWVALYDGDYTVDTLPGYTYRGYAAELAECSRYYQRVLPNASMEVGGSTAITATTIFPGMQINPMRAAPTVACSNLSQLFVTQAGAYSGCVATAIAMHSWSSNGRLTLSITTETGLVPAQFYRVVLGANVSLAFSADL